MCGVVQLGQFGVSEVRMETKEISAEETLREVKLRKATKKEQLRELTACLWTAMGQWGATALLRRSYTDAGAVVALVGMSATCIAKWLRRYRREL